VSQALVCSYPALVRWQLTLMQAPTGQPTVGVWMGTAFFGGCVVLAAVTGGPTAFFAGITAVFVLMGLWFILRPPGRRGRAWPTEVRIAADHVELRVPGQPDYSAALSEVESVTSGPRLLAALWGPPGGEITSVRLRGAPWDEVVLLPYLDMYPEVVARLMPSPGERAGDHFRASRAAVLFRALGAPVLGAVGGSALVERLGVGWQFSCYAGFAIALVWLIVLGLTVPLEVTVGEESLTARYALRQVSIQRNEVRAFRELRPTVFVPHRLIVGGPRRTVLLRADILSPYPHLVSRLKAWRGGQ